MATRALSGFLNDELHRVRLVLMQPEHPVVRRRRAVAAVLTLFLAGLGVVFLVAFGPASLAVYLPMLPLALVLLWTSTGALRFDEREESPRNAADAPNAVESARTDEPLGSSA